MKKLEVIKLKSSPEYNEAWLQQQIWEDPAILGLGDLHRRTKEKILAYGRLDILLEDSDSDNPTRYEVEVQLGDTDESHIISSIEYWDLERKVVTKKYRIVVAAMWDLFHRLGRGNDSSNL